MKAATIISLSLSAVLFVVCCALGALVWKLHRDVDDLTTVMTGACSAAAVDGITQRSPYNPAEVGGALARLCPRG